MARKKNTRVLEVVNPVCCGLDVHKESVTACLLFTDQDGQEQMKIREFETFTDSLFDLRDWLLANNCPIVAMESTGIFWRPVHNVLEEAVTVLVVNARHYHNVPGKKTDLKDSQWLAGLLRHGLLRGSFIPDQEVRDWRDVTKLRKSYVKTVGDYKRRVHKLFETANIKIGVVASDIFGVSGRNLMHLLCNIPIDEITAEDIDTCLRGGLRGKKEELYRAMRGFFREHHQRLLKSLLRSIKQQEEEIERLDDYLEKLMVAHQDLLDRLDELPGVNQVAARGILSQVGPTLSSFPTAGHLASWCGLCPGNHESAGKRQRGRNYVRGHDLKSLMVEVAWAAVKKKKSYYKDKYYKLKARRGAKRAIVAIAHRLLKAVFHIIKHGAVFKDLGEDYLLELTKVSTLKRLQDQAGKLGYQLTPKVQ